MKHTIDYKSILNTTYLGIRRSAVFMALGLNASRDPRLTDYSLSKDTAYQFLPPNLPEEKVSEFKNEFGKWVVTNGFRELIEAFAIFLDRLHEATLLVNQIGRPFDPKTSKIIRKFDHEGIDKKLSILESLGVRCGFSEHAATLWHARNCLTHRRGIVAHEDLNADGHLSIKWKAIEMFAQGDSGMETILVETPGEPFVTTEPSKLCLRYPDRKLSFALKEVVCLQPKQLAEICTFVFFTTHELFAGACAVATAKGINATRIELTFNRAKTDKTGSK